MKTLEELEAEHERRQALYDEYSVEVVDAAIFCFGEDDWQDALEAGAYQGYHGGLTAYAKAFIYNYGMPAGVDGVLVRYFDYEAFGRDLMLGGDILEHNGHIFETNW